MHESTETLTIPIEGMTCGHCQATVKAAIEGVPGVTSATVDLDRKRAEVSIEPGPFDRSSLSRAVQLAGFRVPDEASIVTIQPGPVLPKLVPSPAPSEEWNLAIGGMHCASCVSPGRSRLERPSPESTSASGQPGDRAGRRPGRSRLEVDPSGPAGRRPSRRPATSARSGRTDASVEGADALRRERVASRSNYWRNRLVVGVLLTVPLDRAGRWPRLFSSSLDLVAPRSGWMMFGLAAILQVVPRRAVLSRCLGLGSARGPRTWTP